MTSIVNALDLELAQLEDELNRDPRYVKIQQIKRLLETYRAGGAQSAPKIAAKPEAPIKVTKSKEGLIRRDIRELLLINGKMHRKEILSALVSRGRMKGVKVPMTRLAIYKTRMPDIASDGSGNWWLIGHETNSGQR